MTTQHSSDILIIGGGVVGNGIAYELSRRNLSVTLLEQNTVGSGTSYGAAGMLPPQVEAHAPGPLLEFSRSSFDRYPTWSQELQALTGMSIDLDTRGILQVAETEAGLQALKDQESWQESLGLSVTALSAQEIRDWVPGIRPGIEFGLLTPGGQLQASRLSQSLAIAATHLGAQIHEGVTVTSIRETHADTTAGSFSAHYIIVATGAWLHGLTGVAVRPVKGQRLLLEHAITASTRITVFGENCYLVPKSGAQILAGATEEPNAGFDRKPTLSAILTVGSAAESLCPPLKHARLVEAWAGLRPCTPDGLPVVGLLPGSEHIWVAGGHCRNGILLAPFTAHVVAEAIAAGASIPAPLAVDRFTPDPISSNMSESLPPAAVDSSSTADDMVHIVLYADAQAAPHTVYEQFRDFSSFVESMPDVRTLDVMPGASPAEQESRWTINYMGMPIHWRVRDQFFDDQKAIRGSLIDSNIFDRYTYQGRVTPHGSGSHIRLEVFFRLSRMRGLATEPARQLMEKNLQSLLKTIIARASY